MTLTAPGCPVAQTLPVEVANKVKAVPGVTDAKVDIVWEPAWTKDRMSDAREASAGDVVTSLRDAETSKKADYALMAMKHLATRPDGASASAREIAEQYDIPSS